MKEKKHKYNKKRVIVGMSAGVDSSAAAFLLKKQGYDVIGVFLHFWKEPGQENGRENKCCSLESQEDARKVAQLLDIPLYTVNAARDFKRDVVDYFMKELKSGRTPNPCVACNQRIKFEFLFRKMLEMDADFVATGHYAKIKKKGDKYHLYTSCDENKDQTYFLYNLSQKQLSKILFPVGDYQKPQIRKITEQQGLPVFNKEESQGLCFTPEKNPVGFIKRNMNLKSGEIIDVSGKVLGEHQGLELYTIGQRKGINIGGTGPYFVVSRDFTNNKLVVTNDENAPELNRKTMIIEMNNWVADEPKFPLDVNVKIRYRQAAVRGTIVAYKNSKNQKSSKIFQIEFEEPQRAVTPGQSAVFYADDGEVVGGGVII